MSLLMYLAVTPGLFPLVFLVIHSFFFFPNNVFILRIILAFQKRCKG